MERLKDLNEMVHTSIILSRLREKPEWPSQSKEHIMVDSIYIYSSSDQSSTLHTIHGSTLAMGFSLKREKRLAAS